MSDTSPASNTFGTVASAIGICTVVPLLYAIFFRWIPSVRLVVLNSLLHETEDLFRTAIEDGLMTSDVGLQGLYTQLWELKTHVDLVRAEIYNSKTLWQEFVGWWNGLSSSVNSLCKELTVIKKRVAMRSSRERQSRGSRAFRVYLATRLQHQPAFFAQNGHDATAPHVASIPSRVPETKGCAGKTLGRSDSGHSPATVSRLSRLRPDANARRLLLLEFGKYLLDSHSSPQLHHPSMIPSAEQRRRGQAPGLSTRSMTRYLRRKLRQQQRLSEEDIEADITDVNVTSLYSDDDAESDWEDIAEHPGEIQPVV